MLKNKLLMLIAPLFLLSMGSLASEISFIANAGAILISGPISEGDFLKFEKIVNENTDAKEVVVFSGGGNLLEAMAMGKLIKSKGFDVRVLGVCASACANYLFIAGNKKIIQKNTLIAFHGGWQQPGLLESIKSTPVGSIGKPGGVSFYEDGKGLPSYLVKVLGLRGECDTLLAALPQLINIEKKYFATLAINNDLPTYGQKGVYKKIWDSKKYEGFYYDLFSLRRLGIKNIEVEGGEWDPEKSPLFNDAPLYKVVYP